MKPEAADPSDAGDLLTCLNSMALLYSSFFNLKETKKVGEKKKQQLSTVAISCERLYVYVYMSEYQTT